MNAFPTIILLVFVELLCCTYLLIRRYLPGIAIPFVTIMGASTINAIFFITLRGVFTLWIIAFIAVTLGTTWETKNFLHRRKTKKDNDPSQHSRFILKLAWGIALTITCVLFANALFFQPALREPGVERISARDKLMSQYVKGEDNFSHINLIEAIHKRHQSSYFEGQSSHQDVLWPDLAAYSQLPHMTVSIVETGIYDVGRVGQQRTTHFSSLLYAYILCHFFLAGMLVGLVVTLAISLGTQIFRLTRKMEGILAFAGTAIILRITFFPLLDAGYFSQSAGLIAIFASVYLESNPRFKNVQKQTPLVACLARCVPVIICAHTWWILLPISVSMFAYGQFHDWYRNFKSKEFHALYKGLILTAIAGVITVIPLYSQVVLMKSSPLNIATLQGGIQPISIKVCIAMLILSLFAYIWLYFRQKSIDQPTIRLAMFFMAIVSLYFLAFAVYQYRSTHSFSYYTYKLAWSSTWVIIFSALFFTTALFSRRMLQSILLLIILILSFFFIVDAFEIHNDNLAQSTNLRVISDLASAIDTANDLNRAVVVASDCTTQYDYFLQRAAISAQARIDPDVFQYVLGVISGKFSRRQEEQGIVLTKSTSSIYFFDATPLQDKNSPTDRYRAQGLTSSRTSLAKPWISENSRTACSQKQTHSIP